MADGQTLSEISNLKNSKILVNVEEAVRDVLVVSYEFDSKLYQGVLLDSTKRGLPCGIFSPSNCAEPMWASGECLDEDKTHSVAQRYTYFQDKSPPHGKDGGAGAASAPGAAPPPGAAYHMRRLGAVRGGQQAARFKNSRMTVRLRPRQVLCSKCRSICNENSENVDLSKKRKGEEAPTPAAGHGRLDKRIAAAGHISPKSPRTLFSENQQDNQTVMTRKRTSTPSSVDSTVLHPSLIPKITRLQASQVASAAGVNKLKLVGGYWTKKNSVEPPTDSVRVGRQSRDTDGDVDVDVDGEGEAESRDSRGKVSVEGGGECQVDGESGEAGSGSGVDVDVDVDGDVDGDGDGPGTGPGTEAQHNTSLTGSTGSEADESQDRMVLRKKRNVGSMEDLWDESVFTEDSMRRTTPVIKISFGSQGEGTVLKIPAKVRNYRLSESETEEADNAPSEVRTKDALNSAKAAKRALKRAKKEARRKIIGGTSPVRSLGGSSPAYETLYHRRHKRKVKHKKRHKEGRASKHGTDASEADSNSKSAEEGGDDRSLVHEDSLQLKNGDADSYSAIKERCLKQKLSISLRKLNATAYTRCGDTGSSAASAGSNSPGSNSELSGADGADDVPDFPASQPLMMRVSTQTVASCLTGDGRTMEIGDVVWGKVHGFPWWPGKVLSISVSRKEDGVTMAPQAHVAWYGSSTSSLMPCDELSPFLETFKTRYNKKKRGPYKEAIRQATCEARKDGHRDPPKEVGVAS